MIAQAKWLAWTKEGIFIQKENEEEEEGKRKDMKKVGDSGTRWAEKSGCTVDTRPHKNLMSSTNENSKYFKKFYSV